ncbi:MAG: hypothetical protein ACR2MO_08835 [Acidimicrobiales bacterium]
MRRRERPPVVTRHCNSTRWFLAAAVALVGWIFVADDLPASRPERLDPADEVAVEGRVLGTTPGGATEVRYLHPVTEQRVTAEVHVWDGDRVPERGGTMRLIVQRDNPLAATAEGDAMPLHTNLLVNGSVVLGAALPLLMRRFGVRRTERLVNAPTPTFSMVAVLAARNRRRFRCDLHLYALDALEGEPPLCSVPVLTTGGARIGAQVFPVEVKGSPRPLGRVVARSGAALLWPAARAGRRADQPRPSGPARAVEPLPAVPADGGRPLPSRLLPAMKGELAVLAGALGLVALVAVLTQANAADARELSSSGTIVIGEVVRLAGADDVVVLRYEREGATRTARAPVDYASDYRKGVRYPVRVDNPSDPSRARLVAEPYDAVEPVVWAAVPAVVLTGVSWSRMRSWRRNRRVARDGPWSRAHARAGADPVELVLTDDDGRPVGGVIAREQRAPLSSPVPVVIAGTAEPGDPIAVWLPDGRCLAVVHAATNGASRVPGARWSWSWSRRRPGR